MKYLLSLLFIICLFGCSNSARHAVTNISSQVKKCCASFCVDKSAGKMINTTCTETEAGSLSAISPSVFEISGKLATW